MINSEYYLDKICIVTGGNSGIGYALCEELLNRGAIVYMAGRNQERVDKAALKLSDYGDRIHTLIMDVTVQEQVEKTIEDTASKEGRLDFLFNNAGVGGTMPFLQGTLDDWKTIMDTNLWSVIYGVRAAVPIMIRQGSGHIINTSSTAGILPLPFFSLYSVTKFGVTALTECLKYEYLDKGLHFSTICPVVVSSSIFTKGIDGKPVEGSKIPDNAYPADKAAKHMLDGVAEHKGIIVVPNKPCEDVWKDYVTGDRETEEWLFDYARERRKRYHKGLEDMNLDPEVYEEYKKAI